MDETFHSSSLVIPYLDTRSTRVKALPTFNVKDFGVTVCMIHSSFKFYRFPIMMKFS